MRRLHKGSWVSKPPFQVGPNLSHPAYNNSLQAFWPLWDFPATTVMDLSPSRTNIGTFSGLTADSWTNDIFGTSIKFSATQGIQNTTVIYTNPSTVLAVVRSTGANAFEFYYGPRSSGGAGWGLRTNQYNNTGKIGCSIYSVADYVGTTLTPKKSVCIVAKVNIGSSVIFYTNGIRDVVGVGSSTPDQNGFWLGGSGKFGGEVEGITGNISLFALWNVLLPDLLCHELSVNPWTLFEPVHRRRTIVPAAVPVVGAAVQDESFVFAGW